MTELPTGDDRLSKLIADYREQLAAGRPQNRTTLLAANPDLTDELQSFFDEQDREQSLDTPRRARKSGTSPDGHVKRRVFADYELIEEIARGGMGVVFKARQISLDRIVALKMILSGQFATGAETRRFHAEAQAAAGLDHPNIVPIYEVGEFDSRQYYSMAYIEGGNLAARLTCGSNSPDEAADWVRTLAEAVQYAHDHGIVHRDLKPSNILMSETGPKIADFGLAKRTNAGAGPTMTGDILGTPAYMPPEQAAGNPALVGPLADVYSLGAVLYALLVGRPPFQATTPVETIRNVLEADPVRPAKLRSGVPRDLETVCLKCLEKRPDRRYPSARELADDLARFQAGEPVRARRPSLIRRAFVGLRKRPWMIATAFSLGLILVSLFAYGLIAELRDLKWQAAYHAASASCIAHAALPEVVRFDPDYYSNRLAARSRTRATRLLYNAMALRADARIHTLGLALLAEATPRQSLPLKRNPQVESLLANKLSQSIVFPTPFLSTLHWNSTGTSLITPGARIDVLSGDITTSLIDGRFALFSPDGRHVVVALGNDCLRLLDATTGRERVRLHYDGIITNTRFSQDSRRLFFASPSNPWSPPMPLVDLERATAGLLAAVGVPTPDRSADSWLHVLSLDGSKPNMTLPLTRLPRSDYVTSSDGQRVGWLTAQGTFVVHDMDHGLSFGPYSLPLDGPVSSLALNSDGGQMAFGVGTSPSHPATLSITDCTTGQMVRQIDLPHNSSVHGVRFTPDDRHIVAGIGHVLDDALEIVETVLAWNVSNGRLAFCLPASGWINGTSANGEWATYRWSPEGQETRLRIDMWRPEVVYGSIEEVGLRELLDTPVESPWTLMNAERGRFRSLIGTQLLGWPALTAIAAFTAIHILTRTRARLGPHLGRLIRMSTVIAGLVATGGALWHLIAFLGMPGLGPSGLVFVSLSTLCPMAVGLAAVRYGCTALIETKPLGKPTVVNSNYTLDHDAGISFIQLFVWLVVFALGTFAVHVLDDQMPAFGRLGLDVEDLLRNNWVERRTTFQVYFVMLVGVVAVVALAVWFAKRVLTHICASVGVPQPVATSSVWSVVAIASAAYCIIVLPGRLVSWDLIWLLNPPRREATEVGQDSIVGVGHVESWTLSAAMLLFPTALWAIFSRLQSIRRRRARLPTGKTEPTNDTVAMNASGMVRGERGSESTEG